jgi:triphosphatase
MFAMSEVELKLQVPAAALAAVERELARGATQRLRLQAIYFDTADRRLASAGLALRVRKEGRRWVQTLKRGSAHGIERSEHDVALTVPRGMEPAPDPALHAGTPPGEALRALLAGEAGGLLPLYRTDIWRRRRLLRSPRGTVELALDRGEITAVGPDGQARRWPVCELEVELQRGDARAVTDVAARWAARHGLWLDTRGKAERGDRLSRGLGASDPVPAAKAAPLRWRKATTPAAAWQALLDNLLAHALPNWSEVAGGSPAPEPVHQLRVALRRLRSAERFVAGWPGVAAGETACAWADPAAALFSRLGQARDSDVLAAGPQREVDAALARIGEAPLPLPTGPGAPAWTDAERARHGAVLLMLQAAALLPPAADGPPALRTLAAERLAEWHARLRKDAKRFAALDDEARHRVRKRTKRLRYAVEFAAALFPRAAVEAYLAPLREAQERLGEFNDLCVAIAAYRPLTAEAPQAWFALGVLAGRREAALVRCAQALARWRKAEPFWR